MHRKIKNCKFSGETADTKKQRNSSWHQARKDEKDLEGTWLYEEKKKRGIIEDSPSDNDAPLSYEITTGGGDTLQGAAYYWFFTKLMIITAIIFIPFAIVYRTKTYLHDKEEELGPFTIWTQ